MEAVTFGPSLVVPADQTTFIIFTSGDWFVHMVWSCVYVHLITIRCVNWLNHNTLYLRLCKVIKKISQEMWPVLLSYPKKSSRSNSGPALDGRLKQLITPLWKNGAMTNLCDHTVLSGQRNHCNKLMQFWAMWRSVVKNKYLPGYFVAPLVGKLRRHVC